MNVDCIIAYDSLSLVPWQRAELDHLEQQLEELKDHAKQEVKTSHS